MDHPNIYIFFLSSSSSTYFCFFLFFRGRHRVCGLYRRVVRMSLTQVAIRTSPHCGTGLPWQTMSGTMRSWPSGVHRKGGSGGVYGRKRSGERGWQIVIRTNRHSFFSFFFLWTGAGDTGISNFTSSACPVTCDCCGFTLCFSLLPLNLKPRFVGLKIRWKFLGNNF